MSEPIDDTTALLRALAGERVGAVSPTAERWLAKLRSAGVPDRVLMELIPRVSRVRATSQRDRGIVRWLYPVIVTALAALLMWWYATFTYPVILAFAQSLQLSLPSWLAGVVRLAGWAPGLALVALLGPTIVRRWTGHGSVRSPRLGRGPTSPPDPWSHQAVISELIAVLVEHQVSPREAVSLATELTGEGRETRADGPRGSSDFACLPPLLATSLIELEGSPRLADALRDVGTTYELWARDDSAARSRFWLPVLLGLAAAALATLAYALLLFVPLTDMLQQLVIPLVTTR